MFQMIIYRSTMPEDYEHNNDSLFGAFIRDFTAPQSSVFSASTIIIPNLSVMNWLKDKIAQNLSICANIKFLTLNQYINIQTSKVIKEIPIIKGTKYTIILSIKIWKLSF